jgi:hypothetical protein
MATYADLKTRLATEMVRDDLSGDLETQRDLAIARAIEFYQGERFWFNTGSGSATATTSIVAMPVTMRIIDDVALSDGTLLQKTKVRKLLGSPKSGTPTHWAEYAGGLYVWPTPGSSTALTLYGVRHIDAPTDDSDETVWTNEAYDLISAHSRFILYRDVFRDPEGAQLAKGAIDEALMRLRSETTRRSVAPLRLPTHFPTTFVRYP